MIIVIMQVHIHLNKQILIFNKRNIKQKVYILGAMKELGLNQIFFIYKLLNW